VKTIIPSSNHTSAGALLALLLAWAGVCQGQAPVAIAASQPASAAYSCVQRGPNSRIWQRSILSTNASGDVETNEQSYCELGTGICYLSNGQYVDSVEEVDPIPGGAQALQGRYQVQWTRSANTPGGAVTVTTADGKQLSSTVFGLAYYDAASGSNAAIAGLTNCTGAIVAPNQVIYAGAFSNLNADVLYTYGFAGLSQDIVLHQRPAPPDAYGLSDATSVIQLYTSFINPPQPEITAVTNGNIVDCQSLNWGDMSMGIGQALFLDVQGDPITAGSVQKQWVTVSNATYLIESIPYSSISNQLQLLPLASNLKPARGSVRRLAFLDSHPSRPGVIAKEQRPMKLASMDTTQPRLKIDYDLLSSTNTLTLQGDTTYFVSSAVNITGTPGTLVIEGGTVVKYATNSSAQITATNILCLTSPYSPGIFTSMYDSTVGTVVSNGTPTQGTANYLNFGTQVSQSFVFSNLRFSYANEAITGIIDGSEPNYIEIWDCQFYNCLDAFYATADSSGFPIYAYNVLISLCGTGFGAKIVDDSYLSVTAVNVTGDQVGTFFSAGATNTSNATNSIFTSVTTIGLGYSYCYTGTSAGIYQPTGAGSYYLANGSPYRNAGRTNINSALLTNLQTLTTYPPVVTNGLITTDYEFSPQVQRNTGAPDYGYHYPPIDWAINLTLANATITVVPGTVLAGYGTNGIYLSNNAVLIAAGTATSPVWLVQYNTVQEQSSTAWASTNWTAALVTPTNHTGCSATCSFTDWSVLAGAGQIAGLIITPHPLTTGSPSATTRVRAVRLSWDGWTNWKPLITHSRFNRWRRAIRLLA
jgi:hypothetical protein